MTSEEQHNSDHLREKAHRNNNIVPTHWREEAVIAKGIRQHYFRTGGEKPTLILLHGFSENGLSWSRVAKALENDYDIVMVDARGHGLSGGPETGYSQELLTQDIAGLIEELGLQRPNLFGHSNGALTGLKKNSFLFLRLKRSSIWTYSSMSRLFQRAPPGKKQYSALYIPSCS